jgi:hypothetical protein
MYTRKLHKNGEVVDSDSHVIDGKPYKTWAKDNLYTGIILFADNVNKLRVSSFFKEGKLHRVDGPALKTIFRKRRMRTGSCGEWWVEGKEYKRINLKDYVVLDYYKGKFGLMWYKLVDKDKVFDQPDILGLNIK